MKVTDFFEENYYVGIADTPINESINSVIDAIANGVNTIERAVIKGLEENKIATAIKKFVGQYRVAYVAIRSILALDQYLAQDEKGAGLVSSLYNKLVNGSPDEVKEELRSFYEYATKNNSKLGRTVEYFNKAVDNDLKQKKNGIPGYGLIEEIKNRLGDIKKFASDYIERFKKEDPKTESLVEMYIRLESQGLFEGYNFDLLESESKPEVQCYYAIVDAELSIDGAKHRNIKSVVVARGERPVDALKDMKKNIRKSVSLINQEIKKKKGKVTLKSNLDTLKVYSNIEDVIKKNPSNLVGSDNVSKGIVLLKGSMTHGKQSNEPEIAPFGSTLLRKGSVTRYLNKE